VDAIFSREYDQRLGYRAMVALRNYVQHREFPVHRLGHSATRIEGPEGVRYRHTTGLFISPSELAADGDFKKSVLLELLALGEKVDLTWLVRDYLEGLWVAHEVIRNEMRPELQSCEQTFQTALSKFEEVSSEDSRHLAAWQRVERGLLKDKLPVFMDGIEYRQHLECKNASLANLKARYASSETGQVEA
jgi:hypothetical protein